MWSASFSPCLRNEDPSSFLETSPTTYRRLRALRARSVLGSVRQSVPENQRVRTPFGHSGARGPKCPRETPPDTPSDTPTFEHILSDTPQDTSGQKGLKPPVGGRGCLKPFRFLPVANVHSLSDSDRRTSDKHMSILNSNRNNNEASFGSHVHVRCEVLKTCQLMANSVRGLVARAIRNAIRANRSARIIRN